MSAVVSSPANRWHDHVPYVIGDGMNRVWLLGKILEFNTRVGRNVFVARSNEPNYARFIPGSDSPIGMQGNEQLLMCNQDNLFHEMGHCVGLGHTYFHGGSQLPRMFEGVDLTAYNASRGTYADQGFADVDSMMGYSPRSFGASPRLRRINALCSNNQGLLQRATTAIQALRALRNQPEPAGMAARFRMEMDIPREFRAKLLDFKIAGSWFAVAINSYVRLRALNPSDLDQFAADIQVVKRYWKFGAGFMMRVSDDDAQAIRSVLLS